MGIFVRVVNGEPQTYEQFSILYENDIDSEVSGDLSMGYASLYWIRRDIAIHYGVEITKNGMFGESYHWEDNPQDLNEEEIDALWRFLLVPDTEALINHQDCNTLANIFLKLHVEHFDDRFQEMKHLLEKATEKDYQLLWS